METIYYGHVSPARDRQPSEGCLRAALRASRGTVIISLTLPPPFLQLAPDRHHLAVEGYSRALLRRGPERYWYINVYNLSI